MSNEKEKSYSTSDVMKALNMGRNTLRLYEEMGLLVEPKRTDSGYRQYSDRDVEDLRFILEAKEVGFTLNEIGGLLSLLRNQKKVTCSTISKELSSKVEEIDQQMKALRAKKLFLTDFLSTCKSQGDGNICDIVGAGFNKKACCT